MSARNCGYILLTSGFWNVIVYNYRKNMNSFRRIIRIFLPFITKDLFTFTHLGFAGVTNGVSMFDDEEDDAEEDEKNGICANCGKYDCEC